MNTEQPENDGARPTRRPSRGVVASVTATVLVLGGGGACLAAVGQGPDPGGSGTSAGSATTGAPRETHPPSPAQPTAPPRPSDGKPSHSPSPFPSDDGPSRYRTRDVHVHGYRATDSRLTVAFTGGVCGTYSVSVRERPDRVEVRVTERYEPATMCVMLAKFFHRTVPLHAPLGDREVMGTDGKSIPWEKPMMGKPTMDRPQ